VHALIEAPPEVVPKETIAKICFAVLMIVLHHVTVSDQLSVVSKM
jgi:hypothetical protein